MSTRIPSVLLLAAAVAVLAACSSAPTTEQEPAAVEERKPAPGADSQPVTVKAADALFVRPTALVTTML